MVFYIHPSSCLTKRTAVSPYGHSTADSERERMCGQNESHESGGVVHETCFIAF